MHDGVCLSGKVYSDLTEQSQLVIILVHAIHTCSLSYLHKRRIAGIHDPLHKRLTSMTGRFMAAYPPVIDNPKSGTAESIFRCYNALFQSCRCRYDLKCRTRLIRIADTIVIPEIIQCIQFFLIRHFLQLFFCIIFCQISRIVQIVIRI